jgi:hypothetical protein
MNNFSYLTGSRNGSMHPIAWKDRSRNFALRGFSEFAYTKDRAAYPSSLASAIPCAVSLNTVSPPETPSSLRSPVSR